MQKEEATCIYICPKTTSAVSTYNSICTAIDGNIGSVYIIHVPVMAGIYIYIHV